MNDSWKPIRWYCVNCGTLVMGYMNEDGAVKATCPHCEAVMVMRHKSPTRDTIDVYAASGQVRL